MRRVPESIEEYAARIAAAQDVDGRLGIERADVTGWDVFPFEAEGLRLRPGPVLGDEGPRDGEDASTCRCTGPLPRGPGEPFGIVWEDDDWLLKLPPPSGSPLVLSLNTRRHLDVPDLTDELAAGLGRLEVALVAAVEALPSVQRCHVMRIGDGGAHAHWWFVARPTRMPQLRGSFMVDWDDFLPPVPTRVQHENAAFVVERLVGRLGGRAVHG